MTPDRIREKADALWQAWREEYGAPPSTHALTLALSVAIHETAAGDAEGWEGEHSWGAVQLRSLTSAELAVLAAAGVKPVPKTANGAQRAAGVAAARGALAAAVAAGTIPAEIHGRLHIDSSPGKKNPNYYWMFFVAYDNDVDGARRFIHVIGDRAGSRAVLDRSTGTARELATAMRNQGYYEGFYVQGDLYELVGGKWMTATAAPTGLTRTGRDLNIDAYTGSLEKLLPGIRSALADWSPPVGDPTAIGAEEDDTAPHWVGDAHVYGVQFALNELARRGLAVVDPLLKQDGVPDPKTAAAVKAFQAAHGLPATGIVEPGDVTASALLAALDAPTSSPPSAA